MIRALFRRRPPAAMAPPRPGAAPAATAGWPPVLETPRLTLRVPAAQDYEAFAAFFATPRSVHVGGPVDRERAWRVLGTVIGHWSLRGWGSFAIVPRGHEVAVGLTGPWFPEGWPEPEIGWMLWEASLEGRGLMLEAARAARAHAYRDLGWCTAVSYIAPSNARSIALAERLGAFPDPAAPRHDGDAHVVYRHPAPEVCA